MPTRLLVLLLLALFLAASCAQRPLVWQPRAYVVQEGDTLYSIAFRHKLDWRELAEWNRIDGPGYLILPGQVLRLRPPRGTERSAAPERPSSGPAPPAREAPSRAHREIDWRWPSTGELVEDSMGKGIGIKGRSGQPVTAAAPGAVVYTGSGLVGYGKLIIVKHDNQLLSAYAHNREILVREGQEVDAGQRIATMGEAPGRGTMLHFEIRVDGTAVDPLRYLPAR